MKAHQESTDKIIRQIHKMDWLETEKKSENSKQWNRSPKQINKNKKSNVLSTLYTKLSFVYKWAGIKLYTCICLRIPRNSERIHTHQEKSLPGQVEGVGEESLPDSSKKAYVTTTNHFAIFPMIIGRRKFGGSFRMNINVLILKLLEGGILLNANLESSLFQNVHDSFIAGPKVLQRAALY